MEQQNFKEVFGTTTTAALTETAQTTPGVAGIEQATYQRSEDSPRQQSEQSAVFFISPYVTVEKGFPTEVSDGPAMGDMADTAAVTADIPETEGVASQRRTDTPNHQVGQTALVVIPPDVTVYKGSPTKDSDDQAMGIMAESTVVTADIAGTKDVVSQRSTDTTKHQKEQTALVVIPSDVTVYKGSPTNDSDGPAMSDMTESTDVTGGIADTKEVASQRKIDTPNHQSEHTALDVIPPDVTAYKGTSTKEHSGDIQTNLLRRLGLEERYEHNLITVQEAMTVHTNQPRGEKWSLSQLPWTMLRNIIAVDSTARDCIYTQETENAAETLTSKGQSVFDVRSRFGKDVTMEKKNVPKNIIISKTTQTIVLTGIYARKIPCMTVHCSGCGFLVNIRISSKNITTMMCPTSLVGGLK
ncbi:uncharacterized protein LOC128232738 [Mya arenaria]|uniref:uncharacterized protein LOC128232738 n=1 Tax=Mya arenaria TaxID=6604 RepID=UPI0022E82226|nr:uncharacterized protein LOC128232738 [Mya arenaria]